jgi:hypothetical protein
MILLSFGEASTGAEELERSGEEERGRGDRRVYLERRKEWERRSGRRRGGVWGWRIFRGP